MDRWLKRLVVAACIVVVVGSAVLVGSHIYYAHNAGERAKRAGATAAEKR